jgi:hypothetical protein
MEAVVIGRQNHHIPGADTLIKQCCKYHSYAYTCSSSDMSSSKEQGVMCLLEIFPENVLQLIKLPTDEIRNYLLIFKPY